MTKGIIDLQHARLEQALDARQLTKGQFASLVGVSASTVTKWCQGGQSPEPATFERIAVVLNVETEWLTRSPIISITEPLYRSNATALKAARAKLKARTEWVQEIALLLNEYVEYPSVNLPLRDFTEPEQISNADIESAAEECRALWELGTTPIQDLALAAEGAGIIIAREETEISAIEGLSSWSKVLQRPIIFLSADKANGFRSRFDLAHEIGHLILHRLIPKAEDRDKYQLMERQAHRFAGALLLPAEAFANEVRVPANLDNLLTLKRKWGASVAAMMMRLHALGLLNDEEKLILFKRRSARWGAKSEPDDDKWRPEEPRLMRRTLELLINSGVLSTEAIPRYLGLSNRDVESLCGLRQGYFDKPTAVFELAVLRSQRASTAPMRPDDQGQPAEVVSLNRTNKKHSNQS